MLGSFLVLGGEWDETLYLCPAGKELFTTLQPCPDEFSPQEPAKLGEC